jgi:hypothetical protein
LGYWVLAQKATDGTMKQEYLAKAAMKQGIFVWINQEGEHAPEP